MTDKDLSDNQESTGGKARGANESRHSWKSKWVETTAPRADDPIDDVKLAGPRLNPPEQDEVPGESGEEATDT
jgi:hypothetical protein